MKFVRKYLLFVICLLALLLLAAYASGKEQVQPPQFDKEQSDLPGFRVRSANGANDKVVYLFNANDGYYYVFLPSYADLEQVTVVLSTGKEIVIGNTPLSDGMDCGGFDLETPYAFSVNGEQTSTLLFYRSENVAAMYIDTMSGSMESIHADITHEEEASVILYTADGEIDFIDENGRLKGRGNATWEAEKRPYSLTLSSEGDLLDMGAAANWILLANAFDETNLNNKIMLGLASRVGFQWTPDSRWVDVYLNGEYNGLYLLTERVEPHENRLDIDTASGDFLARIESNSEWEEPRNSFSTEVGRFVQISYPEILSQTEFDRVKQLVSQMERLLLSGGDLSDSSFIDLDSWVRRYLIDEISANIDSDFRSSFFYYSDGVFYAGPVWDYDMAFGNCHRNMNPRAFSAKNYLKADTYVSPYYSALYANESFHSRMKELYLTEFRPLLQQILDQEIDSLAACISKAALMNGLRWREMFDELHSGNPYLQRTPSEMKEYLSSRISFLDSAWLENTEFCTVQFEYSPGGAYWNVTVERGTSLDATIYTDNTSSLWIDSATGEEFDFTQPILTDMILSKQSKKKPFATRDYITFLSIAVLVALTAGFVVMEMKHRRKERSPADESQRTQVQA